MQTQTCDGWPNVVATQVAKKPFQCSLPRAYKQRKRLLKPTCVDLLWVALVRLRANLSSIKVNASHRKPSQVHASRGQTESQVTTSTRLAITCDSVWPGLYMDSPHTILLPESWSTVITNSLEEAY